MAGKTKNLKAPPAREPVEHPEDRKMREEGEAYGAKYGPTFSLDYQKEIAALIGTYSDHDAHELLDTLRERFWLRDWKEPDEGTPLKAAP